MTIKHLLITGASVMLLAGAASNQAGARSTANYPTQISFSRAVELPGMTLPAGNYVFERANPESSAVVVLVRNARGTVQWLGHTNTIERRDGRKTVVQLSEAATGETPRVLTWFPSGSVTGSGFIY